jgi:integrase
MAATKNTISLRSVAAFTAPEAGEARLWDDRIAGFCVRAYAPTKRAPKGRKVFAVKYRVNGRQSWHTIGELGKPWRDVTGAKREALTPDMARDEAEWVIADTKRGDDPRAAARARRKARTVGEQIDLYLTEGPTTKPAKRASSWSADRSNLDHHLRPLLGGKLSTAIGKEAITKMLAAVTAGATARVEKTRPRGKAIVKGGAGVAHRVLSASKAMFAWAIEHGHHVGPNPCLGVRLTKRPAVERFLSNQEVSDLLAVIGKLEADGAIRSPHAAIFKLLLLTGARRNEIVALRWREVDFGRELIVLPPARSKAGEVTGERHIPLSGAAMAILRQQPRPAGAVFVFPATKGESGHTTTLPKVWRTKVRPAADMNGLRIHDFRHSFASFALADGASLPMIGKALGHRNARSTERYAHLGLDPVRALSEKVAERMAGAGAA